VKEPSTGTPGDNRASPESASASTWPGGPFLISTLPPSERQRSIARTLVVLQLATFLVAVLGHDVRLRHHDAFVPITNTIVCVNDVITAALLYVQFSLTRRSALLVLASGFLFRAAMMVPHTLTFPSASAPGGWLNAPMQTTAYLNVTQHFVFMLSAVAYSLLRDRRTGAAMADRAPIAPIVVAIATVVSAAVLASWLLLVTGDRLPPIMLDAVDTTSGFKSVWSRLFLLEALVPCVVFCRRTTSMIDLWLKVAVWSWQLETLLILFVKARYTLVFYVARTMGAMSSSFVLAVFLVESAILHRRLVSTLVAREQDRERHRTTVDVVVNTLAHELRQPLMAILVNQQAGSRLLTKGPGATEDVAAALDDVRASALRANEVIDSVRTMFAATAGEHAPVDPNALVRDAVDLTRLELEAHGVAVQLDLAPNLRSIAGHRGQLLEVLLNGMKNAVESLVDVVDRERQLRIRTSPLLAANSVVITLEDSGNGLDPRTRGSVFEPFFTTKAQGMGLGLSICESIVSAHGGALSLVAGSPFGAVLRVELPCSVAAPRLLAASESHIGGKMREAILR
jgi:signal transduction histidine kinase